MLFKVFGFGNSGPGCGEFSLEWNSNGVIWISNFLKYRAEKSISWDASHDMRLYKPRDIISNALEKYQWWWVVASQQKCFNPKIDAYSN